MKKFLIVLMCCNGASLVSMDDNNNQMRVRVVPIFDGPPGPAPLQQVRDASDPTPPFQKQLEADLADVQDLQERCRIYQQAFQQAYHIALNLARIERRNELFMLVKRLFLADTLIPQSSKNVLLGIYEQQ